VRVRRPGAGQFTIMNSRDEAAKDADVIYCDSWMSYGIAADERQERFNALMPYQVNRPSPLPRYKPDAHLSPAPHEAHARL
jgi:ornithine carbamoyltransferase